MSEVTFGELLRNMRLGSGIGSRELSLMVNKTPTYVSQIERGTIKKPHPRIAKQLLMNIGLDENEVDKLLFNQNITFKTEIDKQVFTNKFSPLLGTMTVKAEVEKERGEIINNNSFPWINNEQLITLNNEIHRTLEAFIKEDYTRAKSVINKLHILLNSNKKAFNYFCELLEKNNETILNFTSTLNRNTL